MLDIAREKQQTQRDDESCSRPVLEHPSHVSVTDNVAGLKRLLVQPFNILLLFLPVALASQLLDWPDEYEFWLCFFSLMPLAKILSDATEEVSTTIGSDEIGGMMAATFGNATEITVSIILLVKNRYQVVKMALLGSVLSCLLFVLGMASFAGSVMGGKGQCNIPAFWYALPLGVAVFLIIVATVVTHATSIEVELVVSRSFSFMSIIVYSISMFLQIRLRKPVDGDVENDECMEGKLSELNELGEDCKPMSLWLGTFCLASTIVVMAFVSELLSDDLDAMLSATKMTETFFAVIFLPLIVNVADALAATRFAMHDRIDLSVGICLGSSVQLSSFVLPAAVLIAWALGNGTMGENLTLTYGPLSVSVLSVSAVVVLVMAVDGRLNAVKGAILLCMFCATIPLYWFLADTNHP